MTSSHCSGIVKRPRESRFPAIPMEKAIEIIQEVSLQFEQVPDKFVPVNGIKLGRVISEAISAPYDVPQVRTSTMDGYAVIASDGDCTRKRVVGCSIAGLSYPGVVKPGECVRINTGAIVPDGADGVVPVENTELIEHDGQEEKKVDFRQNAHVGQYIRQIGSEMEVGEVLISPGCEISPSEIGLLSYFGIQGIRVFEKPRVYVFSTGNELYSPMAASVPPGSIRDSNRPQLLAIFQQQGFKAIDDGIVADSPEAIQKAIHTAVQFSSVIVCTGGVSMGEKDYVKDVLEKQLNFKLEFGRVWMKPGMPCTFAHTTITHTSQLRKKVAVFALPGNPASAYVCAQLFVCPFLKTIGGYAKKQHTLIKVKAGHEINLGPRPEYVRAWLKMNSGEDLPTAYTTGNQISSSLKSLSDAKVLLVLPQADQQKMQIWENETVQALLLDKY